MHVGACVGWFQLTLPNNVGGWAFVLQSLLQYTAAPQTNSLTVGDRKHRSSHPFLPPHSGLDFTLSIGHFRPQGARGGQGQTPFPTLDHIPSKSALPHPQVNGKGANANCMVIRQNEKLEDCMAAAEAYTS